MSLRRITKFGRFAKANPFTGRRLRWIGTMDHPVPSFGDLISRLMPEKYGMRRARPHAISARSTGGSRARGGSSYPSLVKLVVLHQALSRRDYHGPLYHRPVFPCE